MLGILSLLLTHSSRELIVANQSRSDWVIVVARTAKPATRWAANELGSTLTEITGASFPITTELPRRGHGFVLEDTPRLREEEFTLQTSSRGLTIRGGGNRGTMYGVFGFLQDALGCRWFTPKVKRIPKLPVLAMPSLNVREHPAFEYREPYFTEALERGWALHNRLNGSSMPLDPGVGGRVSYGKFVHTFSELVPPETYFKTHPEYFSFAKGQRQSGYAQLCLTNPDVLQITIAKVREWIKADPTATIFSVSQNDTYLNCECETCRKVEKEEGSASGPLLRFVNSVADAIAKKAPNVLIDTLAYQWSEAPPKLARPHKNVRIRLAPIGACVSHPLDGCARNAKPLANLKEWAKITNQLYVWHYCTNFAHYQQPLPDLDEIPGDLRLFQKQGVVGIFFEGDYAQGGGGDLAELKDYLMARLMWSPSLPVKPLIDEYLSAIYKDAAPAIAQWIALTHAPARATGIDAGIYDHPNNAPYFSNELIEKGVRLFDDAESAVANDAQAREQVQRARLGLQYIQFMRAKEGSPERRELIHLYAERLRKFGIQEISEGNPAGPFLKRMAGE